MKIVLKKISLFMLMTITLMLVISFNVKAASKHKIELKAVVCDPMTYNDDDPYTNAESCLNDYMDGNLESYVKTNGQEIDAGTIVLVVVNYVYGDVTEVTGINATLKYDPAVWTPMKDVDGFFEFADTAKENFPKKEGRKNASWENNINLVESSSEIKILTNEGSGNGIAFTTDTEIGYFFMQINEDVAGGSKANITFKTEQGGTSLSDKDGGFPSFETEDISFNVPGESLSQDASLKTLTVKNNSITYPLNPSFSAGNSDITKYSTVVPNDIEYVDIAAEVNDNQAHLLSGGVGHKQLEVGENSYEISVTSAYGNTVVYTVEVYRLSNDATLSNITLTNDINIGPVTKEKFEYTANVDYKVSSTNITAYTTHEKAFVSSGSGLWELKNTGSNTNTKIIEVKAENCLKQYESVQGNSCTTKNYTLTITRTAPSNNSNLSSLTIDGNSVDSFNSGTTEYTYGPVSNNTEYVDVQAIVEDANRATVSGTGRTQLQVGDNKIQITVTAEDKTTKTYTVNIHRLSNENKLESLVVTSSPQSQLSPLFVADFNTYSYSYDATVTNISITATVKDVDKAKVAIYDENSLEGAGTPVINTQTKTFTIDVTKVLVAVTAEDGTVNTYTINLSRKKSTDSTLSDLHLNHGTLNPEFTKENKSYTAEVEPDITSVEVTATPTSPYAHVTSKTVFDDLQFGNNRIEIVVEAEDKSTVSYFIDVTRKKYDIATLQEIKINGVSIKDFNPETFEYTLEKVDFDTKQINIETTKTNEYSTVTGDGTVELNTGENEIQIKVVSQDESKTNIYKLKIEREKNSDNSISELKVKGHDTNLVDSMNGVYEVTLPNDITTINPEDVTFTYPTDATVEKDMVLKLSTKNTNEYKFKVRAENGSEKEYSIKITRTKSNDSSISRVDLKIDGDSVERYCLMQGTNECRIDVPVDTTKFKLKSYIHEEASVSPDENEELTMDDSEERVTLTVTAEDQSTSTYTVLVVRQQSSNANLSELKVNGQLVSGFTKEQQTYEMVVDGTVEEAMVTAKVEDDKKAHIETNLENPFALQFDIQNKIEIVVVAEDGGRKTYTIYITRKHRTDTSLSDLKINGVQIDGFDSTKDDYILDEQDYQIHQLNIEAIPNDELAQKTGDGLVRINTGDNTITITVTAHDTSVTKDYKIHVKRKLNNDKGIKSITLAGQTASYNESTQKYEVTVDNSVKRADSSNLVVLVNDPATEQDAKAEYSFSDKELLTTEPNEIIITVTAEDKTTKQYTLVVERKKSNIATLDSLSVTNGSFSPSFRKDEFTYDVVLPVDAENFDVTYTKTEEHSSVTGDGHYVLESSSKQVKVIVVSEDLSVTNTYTLNVMRTKSSNNTLSDIILDHGQLEPEFQPDITSYTVNVDGSVEKINIQAITADERASVVEGNGERTLTVGNNIITIRVQSETGAFLDYTVNVIRAQKQDNNLLSITVDGTPIKNFQPDVLEYNLDDVEYNKTSVNIDVTKSDEDATVEGIGNRGLQTGENTLEIKVKAQNGLEKTYVLKINRAKNDNANLSLLSVKDYILDPNFESSVENYEILVDPTKKVLLSNDVFATAEDNNATILKDGDLTLVRGQDNYYKVKVTAENGETTKTYTITVKVKQSNDATLESLRVDGATLSPNFSNDKHDYVISVPYGSHDFNVTATASDEKAKVLGDGQHNIEERQFQITVTAEDGTEQTYNFTIVEAASNDASLQDLSVSGYPFTTPFSQTTLHYDIGQIYYGTSQLVINAVANNAQSNIEYSVDGVIQPSNVVTIPSTVGSKIISVKVTAPDGITMRTYNILYNLVYSNNAYLSMIKPSFGSIDFLKTTTHYEMVVPNEVTSIDFDITTDDSNAKITVNGDESFTPKKITLSELQVGNNYLTILVTAQDSSTKTYTVVVKRLDKTASDDANLSSLSVEGYELDKTFNMDELEYSIGDIPFGITSLTVNASLNYDKSQIVYLVNGIKQSSNIVEIPKVDGNGAIIVQVIAEDGQTIKNYKIIYHKKANDNAYLENIIVSSGTLNFNKNTYSYTVDVDENINSINITAITADETAKMHINGSEYTSPHTYTISPLNAGSTSVTITVTAENGTVLTYKVIIKKKANILEKITSEIYGHKIIDNYIQTVKVNTTGLDMKNQLDNNNEYLEIWTADETRKVDDSENMATGMIVKLIIDHQEKDRKIIVVKGDTDGDAIVDLFDAVKILNHFLSINILDGAYCEAAYVDSDNEVDLFDSVKILNYYLGIGSLY